MVLEGAVSVMAYNTHLVDIAFFAMFDVCPYAIGRHVSLTLALA